MSNDEWNQFRCKLVDLYPGKINAAQAEQWKAKVLGLQICTALSALSDLYEAQSGGTPRLDKFMSYARKLIDESKRHKKGNFIRDDGAKLKREYESLENSNRREIIALDGSTNRGVRPMSYCRAKQEQALKRLNFARQGLGLPEATIENIIAEACYA